MIYLCMYNCTIDTYTILLILQYNEGVISKDLIINMYIFDLITILNYYDKESNVSHTQGVLKLL